MQRAQDFLFIQSPVEEKSSLKTNGIKYQFSAKPWLYAGPGSWHFISLPQNLAAEIRSVFKQEEEGWGRLKVTAKIGNSEWKTAIWYDRKRNTYLLPLKAEIRNLEKVDIDNMLVVILWI